MKFKKTMGVAMVATILLAGCNNDKEYFENYNNGLEKMQKAEAPIQNINKEMNKLEKEKEKISKEVSGKDISKVQDKVKAFLDNAAQREKQLDKESKAMAQSEKDFQNIKKESNKIEDKDDKKEYDQLNQALEEKYKKHKDFVKGYQNIINKEKDLFGYFKNSSGTQQEVDKRSEALNKAQKEMKKKVDNYTKAIRKVQTEKQDVDEIANN
ncbi:YkyA family protein [Staphylococcus schleiferi subsp. coagulans]|uniref:YkyA family protein n=1 Tax=Staphylococcus coagulans TaxID=74706 RepID=UPI0015FB9009|nr:YkyA family protein [Staphylococcus coagulans]MBA8778119.1 YkyA family protein [Staphylococcus coagulans]